MYPAQFAKQMIDFQKTAFDNTFKAAVMLQDQAESVVNMMLERNVWLPEEGRKSLRAWVEACKEGRESFKACMDDNFKTAESFFKGVSRTPTTKNE